MAPASPACAAVSPPRRHLHTVIRRSDQRILLQAEGGAAIRAYGEIVQRKPPQVVAARATGDEGAPPRGDGGAPRALGPPTRRLPGRYLWHMRPLGQRTG